jgi:hypothetical protein
VISATSAAPGGSYTVMLTVSDPAFPAGIQTQSFPLYIIAPSSSLSLAQSASATEGITFNTASAAASASLLGTSISCPYAWDTVNKKTYDNAGQKYITCSAPDTPVTGATTAVALKITAAAGPTTTAQALRPSGAIYAATLLGVPFLAILCWFGSKNSPRRNLFRFLSMIVLLLGLSYATGCGGGFTPPPPPPVTGIPPGNYLVQVVAKDGAGKSYYAEVPLAVASTN